MKFSYNLILFILSVQTREVSPSISCFTKAHCKAAELLQSPESQKKIEKCATKAEGDEIMKCIYEVVGFKHEQIETITKLSQALKPCVSTNLDVKIVDCTNKCTSDSKDECAQKCAEPFQQELGNCMLKLADQPNFDIKKSMECSSKCNQETLSEVYDCDYKCNKDIYDILISKTSPDEKKEESNSTDTNAETSKDDDKKSGSSTQPGSSGTISMFENNTITAISFATLLSLFLF